MTHFLDIISDLSLDELTDLAKRIEVAIEVRLMEEKISAIRDIQDLVQSQGLSIEDLFGRRNGLPKFRSPEDPKLTWNGVGRRPKWFVNALRAGIDPADMEI